MEYPWFVSFCAGLVLQLLIIRSMSRGAWRSFFVVFVYCIVMVLATVAQGASFFPGQGGRQSPRYYAAYYWVTDGILQVLMLALVLSLLRRAASSPEKRGLATRIFAGTAIALCVLSIQLYKDRALNTQMTLVARNLGFFATLANLILWASLIRSRHPDRTVLLLSGGLGVEMAGKAIGHSLRTLATGLVGLGNLVIVLSYLFGLYVWWQAFRHWQPNSPPRPG